MIFHVHSFAALKSLEIFEEHYQNRVVGRNPQVLEKVKRCGYHIWLVAGDGMVLSDEQPGELTKRCC